VQHVSHALSRRGSGERTKIWHLDLRPARVSAKSVLCTTYYRVCRHCARRICTLLSLNDAARVQCAHQTLTRHDTRGDTRCMRTTQRGPRGPDCGRRDPQRTAQAHAHAAVGATLRLPCATRHRAETRHPRQGARGHQGAQGRTRAHQGAPPRSRSGRSARAAAHADPSLRLPLGGMRFSRRAVGVSLGLRPTVPLSRSAWRGVLVFNHLVQRVTVLHHLLLLVVLR
jgi:hypothetical protein